MALSHEDFIAELNARIADEAIRKAGEEVTDEELIGAIRDAEKQVTLYRQRGARVRRLVENDDGDMRPINLLPKRPLEYQGPYSEEDYPLIYASERYHDYLNPDPGLFELGRSSGLLKLENEHIRKLIPGMSASVQEKKPIFR